MVTIRCSALALLAILQFCERVSPQVLIYVSMDKPKVNWNLILAVCLSAFIGGSLAMLPGLLFPESTLVQSLVAVMTMVGTAVFIPVMHQWVERLAPRSRSYLWLVLGLLWVCMVGMIIWLVMTYSAG